MSPPRHTSGSGRGRARTRGDGGQATVELALTLPLVMLVLLGAVQVALVTRDQITAVHAAREGARAAAVAAKADAAGVDAARQASGLDPQRLEIDVVEQAGRVEVRVRYASPTEVPLIGDLLGDVVVRAEAVMRIER